MLDPVTITAVASGLAGFALQASKSITSFISDVKSADTSLLHLQNEVETFHLGLKNIASTFGSDEILQLSASTSASPDHLRSNELLNSIGPLLTDCERTLDNFAAVLTGIKARPGCMRELLSEPIKAIKIELRSKDIELIRHELRSYSSAIQMSLQMASVCLLVGGNRRIETIGSDMEQKLTTLVLQISDVQRRLNEAAKLPELENDSLLLSNQGTQAHRGRFENHIRSAKALYKNASSYIGSVSGAITEDRDEGKSATTDHFESVRGLDDHQKHNINRWIANGYLPEVIEDNDLESEILEVRLDVARARLKVKDYEAAKQQYRKCLETATSLKEMPHHIIFDIKLDLSLACQGSADYSEEQQILLELLEGDLPESQSLHLRHRLAASYMHDSQLSKAHKAAGDAMKGRRKLLGRRDEAYHETVTLLAQICEAQNNPVEAEVYYRLLLKDQQHLQTQQQPLIQKEQPIPQEGNTLQNESKDLKDEPGADMTSLNEEAAALGLFDTSEFSINNEEDYFKVLYQAIERRHENCVSFLLSRMQYIHGSDDSGYTMLHFAVALGLEFVVQELIKRGVNINATSLECADGLTPLHIAAYHGDVPIMQHLIENGANIDKEDINGCRPLGRTIWNGDLAATKLLLKHGADCEAKDTKLGRLPIIFGVHEDKVHVLEALVSHGVDVNAKDGDGFTALLYAAQNGCPQCARILLQSGADSTVRDECGCSVMDLAENGDTDGHKEVRLILRTSLGKRSQKTSFASTLKNSLAKLRH